MARFLHIAFLLLLAYVLSEAEAQVGKPAVYRPNIDHPKIIQPTYRPNVGPPRVIQPTYRPVQPPTARTYRFRRFVGGSNLNNNGQNNPNNPMANGGWVVKPDVRRDGNGNVKGSVEVKRNGENHDFEAGWGQTVRGKDKHSETWHVGGTYRFPN